MAARRQVSMPLGPTHRTLGDGSRHESRARPFSEAAKRTLDLTLAGSAILVLSPVMATIALVIRLTGRGPVLFRQVRVGRWETPFVMYKFRTMRHGSDDSVHRAYVTSLLTEGHSRHGGHPGIYKLSNDPRVTRVGSFLRRTSLDELPQLFNVIRGDMSLVGPRPALPYEAELFKVEHRVRFAVKPGITGLWQVKGRNTLTMLEGLELDAEYVARRGLALDISILAMTVPAVFISRGAR